MTKTSSLADMLCAKMEASIRAGDLSPGSQLPTQKVIAEDERVSRTVVREAMARLEAQGLIVARQGSGVYVAQHAPYRAFQVTRDELSELSDVIRLLETRLAIEAEMAAFAAARRSTEDVTTMRAALHRIAEVSEDPVAAAAADVQFHLSIARAARNDYFVRLIEFLGVRLVPPRTLFLQGKPAAEHRRYAETVRDEHEAIVEGISRMDPGRARQAAWRHMHESLQRHTALGTSYATGTQDRY